MSHDTIVRERLDAVLDRSNIPTWVDQTDLRAELYKVVDRMLKAERGATIPTEAAPKYCECPPGTDRCITQGGHFPACTACKRRLK